MKIVVGARTGRSVGQGGATWAILQYVHGLRRLGHDVVLVEEGEAPPARADLLLNVSGVLPAEPLQSIPIRVYLDLDPTFTQLWHAQGEDVGLEGHTHHVTLGSGIAGWIHSLPPVVLEHWPVAERIERDALTTVANWRSYGTVEHEGARYGQKAHSFRELLELPALTGERFELALAIDPGDEADLEALREHGWHLLDPVEVAGTPEAYAGFVRGSKAELGVAKEGYVRARSGWFSDRSACYLASGRPVLAQDTGFGEVLPTGAGLFAFATTGDVVAALEELRRDYGRHARAARAIAEEFLDSDRVLARLLQAVGAASGPIRTGVHDASEAELAAGLAPLRVKHVHRRPSAYRSTYPIAELDVELEDGSTLELVLKELRLDASLPAARAAKDGPLHDPLRELEVYRDLLPEDLGAPRFYGAHEDRGWLYLERVAGRELYQVGELELWHGAMRWLAGLHDRFAGIEGGRLTRYDESYFDAADGNVPAYRLAATRLAALPRTLVHGDLYASNVLVADGRVCALDWELAGTGPGVLDVAALTMGWPEEERLALAESYRLALASPPARDDFLRDLDSAALHLAVRWLGSAGDWSPPPEHLQDWPAEVERLAARMAT